ncbi:MAG TPA: hypothetical protein QGI39_05755 [Gammaproteobacteria bacterium]|nr:hypothetical protein [Gammaproteobacteria bacterium]HJO11526.1 hypothetical protein [Gammaproteobacteria bacterium]
MQIERFDSEVVNSEVIVFEDAGHAIFISHRDEVANSILQFIGGLGIYN